MRHTIPVDWQQVRTAYEVARHGTLSDAARVLGLHRATVARHVDALESELGARLFHRHARGYVPTEVGEDLFRVARATDDQFEQLASRTRSRSAELSGELVVTSLEVVAPPLVAAAARYQTAHPRTRVRYRVSAELLRLEYGEAHVAVRAGPRPDHPDNVVQPFLTLRSAVYGHRRYLEDHGLPASEDDLGDHTFVVPDPEARHLPFQSWLRSHVPSERWTFVSSNLRLQLAALRAGLGLAFAPVFLAEKDPDLVEVLPARDDWDVPFWLLTHVDLHRSPKVQAFLRLAKEEAGSRV
ncbi:MAG: LysR family transcriptional regulator [Myxococcota bacterium]